jgi:hypothetical protein
MWWAGRIFSQEILFPYELGLHAQLGRGGGHMCADVDRVDEEEGGGNETSKGKERRMIGMTIDGGSGAGNNPLNLAVGRLCESWGNLTDGLSDRFRPVWAAKRYETQRPKRRITINSCHLPRSPLSGIMNTSHLVTQPHNLLLFVHDIASRLQHRCSSNGAYPGRPRIGSFRILLKCDDIVWYSWVAHRAFRWDLCICRPMTIEFVPQPCEMPCCSEAVPTLEKRIMTYSTLSRFQNPPEIDICCWLEAWMRGLMSNKIRFRQLSGQSCPK